MKDDKFRPGDKVVWKIKEANDYGAGTVLAPTSENQRGMLKIRNDITGEISYVHRMYCCLTLGSLRKRKQAKAPEEDITI